MSNVREKRIEQKGQWSEKKTETNKKPGGEETTT